MYSVLTVMFYSSLLQIEKMQKQKTKPQCPLAFIRTYVHQSYVKVKGVANIKVIHLQMPKLHFKAYN